MSPSLEKSKRESLWGFFVGDALAMPVHWYYNPPDIKHGYKGWLQGYTAPARRHPSSILTISATGGSGRSGWNAKKKPVIGDVILHDKLKFWTSGDRSTHYHQGMAEGDNTLNALTALETVKVMQKIDPDCTLDTRALQEAVMENYVLFMTTPGTHNDTYAESFHRSFFQEWRELDNPPRDGKSIVDFAEKRYKEVSRSGHEDHQLAVIGALVLAVPWVLHYSGQSADVCSQKAVEAIRLTHPAPSLGPYVELYSRLLHAVLNGASLQQDTLEAASAEVLGGRRKRAALELYSKQARRYPAGSEGRLNVYQDATSSLGSACYIEGALSSLLLLAHEFHDDFSNGVLTNANCGGENVHRGAALAALLGAATVHQGTSVPEKWKEGLHSAKPTILKLMEKPF